MESEEGPYRGVELSTAERLATQRHLERMAALNRLTVAVSQVASGVTALPFYLYAIVLWMSCLSH